MKFGFHRENVDFVKIMVFPRGNNYFLSRGFQKSIKNSEKNDAKCDVKNHGQKMTPKLEKNNFWSHFGLPKPSFFSRFWL